MRLIVENCQQLKNLIVKISINVTSLSTDYKLDTLPTTGDHLSLQRT